MRHVIDHRPGVARQVKTGPALHHGQKQHFGPQDIVAFQFLRTQQLLHAKEQIVVFGASLLEHTDGQTRCQNLVFSDIGRHQFKSAIEHLVYLRQRWLQGQRPDFACALDPVRPGFLVGAPGVAPILHFPRGCCLIPQLGKAIEHDVAKLLHDAPCITHKATPRFLR